MIGPAWTVPMEAIRHCANVEGAVALAQLDTKFAKYRPHQRVEITPVGFVAHIGYELPPYNGRIGSKTIVLTWAARENGAAVVPSHEAIAAAIAGERAQAKPEGGRA